MKPVYMLDMCPRLKKIAVSVSMWTTRAVVRRAVGARRADRRLARMASYSLIRYYFYLTL